jgi:fatty acid/phospholipid biosynthesis enzyme
MTFPRTLLGRAAAAAALLALLSPAHAQDTSMQLFKITTVRDEIVIGLSAQELSAFGGSDAGAIAHALTQRADLTAWQYNVKLGANGELQQTPTAKVGLLAHSSLRVEPYKTPYPILPHE